MCFHNRTVFARRTRTCCRQVTCVCAAYLRLGDLTTRCVPCPRAAATSATTSIPGKTNSNRPGLQAACHAPAALYDTTPSALLVQSVSVWVPTFRSVFSVCGRRRTGVLSRQRCVGGGPSVRLRGSIVSQVNRSQPCTEDACWAASWGFPSGESLLAHHAPNRPSGAF